MPVIPGRWMSRGRVLAGDPMTAWPIVVFGFPGAIVSVAVSALGVAYLRAEFLFLGAALAVPSALYLAGHPGMWLLLFMLPGLPFVAAVAVMFKRRLLAASLLVPNAAAALWLTGVTIWNLVS